MDNTCGNQTVRQTASFSSQS